MLLFLDTEKIMDDFKLNLLLSCLRITCKYFKGDEEICGISESYISDSRDVDQYECHITCNCDGDIGKCDLPEKFQRCL